MKRIRLLFCIFGCLHGMFLISQTDTIYFSVTGDTVLFTDPYLQPDSVFHYIVLRKSLNDTTDNLSSYGIKSPALKPYKDLNPDTLKKYGLTYNGIRADAFKDPNIRLSVKTKHIKYVAQYDKAEYQKFIYKCVVHVSLRCKGKRIYHKRIPYMFDGMTKQDFDPYPFSQVVIRKRKDRYMVRFYVQEQQMIKANGFFQNSNRGYLFIL